MILGTSEIEVTHATIIAAVQAYFAQTFAPGKVPKVISVEAGVRKDRYSNEHERFVVKLEEETPA